MLRCQTDAFVPPLEGDLDDEEPELEALDELGRSRTSAAELRAFFSALAAAVEPPDQETGAVLRPAPADGAKHGGRGAARVGRWLQGRERH